MNEEALREQLTAVYGFEFPEDFWRFWQFYQGLKAQGKEELFDELGISLVGPFDFLKGRFEGKELKLPIQLHWRFFMDPPEFFTVLAGDCDGLHWGYWIDDVKSGDFCVASYYNNDAYEIGERGKTLFEAVRLELEASYGHLLEDYEYRKEEEWIQERITKLDQLRDRLTAFETGERKEIGWDYWEDTVSCRKETAEVSYGMGIVVPAEMFKTEAAGAARLIAQETAEKLYNLAMEYINEGFAGNALQIGKELWFYGETYGDSMYPILEKTYKALGREELAEILLLHKAYRDLKNVDLTQFKVREYDSIEKALQSKEKEIALSLVNQGLTEVPDEIGRLKNIIEINLAGNSLTELKECLFELTNCAHLNLVNNNLESISSKLGKLVNLEEIYLFDNALTSLPEEICQLKKLRFIQIMRNPLSEEEKERIKGLVPWAKVYF